MHLRQLPVLAIALLGVVSLARAETSNVATSAEQAQPLVVGAKAPLFVLPAVDDTTVSLADAFAAKPTILVFYRGSWCPFCNRQLAALGELEPQLLELGYQIIAISPDDAAGLKKMADTNHLTYRLLSDRAMRASPAYGVAYRVAPALAEKYREHHVDLPAQPDGSGPWLPVPAVFLVGRDGVIKFVYANPDYRIRLSNDDLLAAAKANAAK
jgi:peroxiredoxin